MKKFILIILALVLTLTLASCGGEKSPASTETSVSEPTVEPTAEPAAEYEGPWVLTNYSMNSYIHTDYVYDENGNITREDWRNTKMGNTGSSNYTYTQNADGTTTVRRMAEDEALGGDEFIFDSNGWCTESIYYSDLTSDPAEMFTEDNKESITTYEYDESGRLIRTTCESLKNSWGSFIKEYAYDENNRLISRIEKSFETGEALRSYTITYSEDGSTAQAISTSGSESYTDNYTHEDIFRLDVLTNSVYTHDDNGGRWTEYSYEYDENGVLSGISYRNTNLIVPVEYFIGMGHFMEECDMHSNLVFKPLSVVLAEQSAN